MGPVPAPRKPRKVTRRAVAETTSLADAQAAVREPVRKRPGGPGDPFTGELRRREVLPLLVMHVMAGGPSYGNQLMDRISELTEGVLSVNPNTMYPLLRQLEGRGLIEGRWEHPERRSRRYYSLTADGKKEYRRLRREVRPFLDSVGRSIDEIVREVYGGD
jgi:DNA-binding PadR family transcriptional regulator